MGMICIDVPGNMNLNYQINNTEIINKIVRIIKSTGAGEKPSTSAKHFQSPLKQNPRLMGVKLLEDPTAPLDEEDWPQTLS